MEDPEKLLEKELGDIGGPGARSVARRLANNVFEVAFEVGLERAHVLEALSRAVDRLGRVITREETDGDASIRAVVGAGLLSKNPAIVDIRITKLDMTRSRVLISGVAKEGLIRQRAGEGAVRKILKLAGLPAPDL